MPHNVFNSYEIINKQVKREGMGACGKQQEGCLAKKKRRENMPHVDFLHDGKGKLIHGIVSNSKKEQVGLCFGHSH